jgi:hypothetical protein
VKNNFIRYLCLFTLLLIATHLLPAQQLATLKVTVSDPSGKLVAGARITLNNAGTALLAIKLLTALALQSSLHSLQATINLRFKPMASAITSVP